MSEGGRKSVQAPLSRPSTLPELIEARAGRDPRASAVLAPDRDALSREELLAATRATAAALRGLGVGRGERVALVAGPGPEAALAFLAIASVATCAPLNPAYREAELEFYLSDLRARFVLVAEGIDTPVREVARALGVRIVDVVIPEAWPAGRFRFDSESPSGQGSVERPAPEDIALALHTSGTTGRPKLVPLSHANLCASALNVAATLGLTPDDRCLNVMPLFHIHGLVAAVLASLGSGGSVVCAPGFLAPRFFDWVDELSPTWYTAVPTMHQAILARAKAARPVIERSRLRFARSSSSALPPPVQAGLEAELGIPVIEAYGMTEAAHQMASNPVPPGERRIGSVGRPAGPELAVLDERGVPLPAGTVGEVAVRGDNVFAGYADNPDANACAFTDGWFRTGDEGYLDTGGYLYLRGRIKEIINRAGEKIAPREIDDVLLSHPAVSQAVTFALPDPRLGEDVAAAVVLREGARVTEAELQERVATRLAAFKVPRVVCFVEEIPKGPTGKLQRIGLADLLGLPSQQPATATRTSAAPKTGLERELASLWARTLGLDGVDVEDDFFALGGDSMLGAQLLVTLRERFPERRLPLTALVRAPTVAAMAELIAAARSDAPEPALVGIRATGSRAPFFFVHSLEGVVMRFAALARRLDPEQPFYGLQAMGVEGGAIPHNSLEDMAADYLAEIREVQPTGPYVLGGVCMGGPVALEMARSLLEVGETVALLALVDPRVERSGTFRYYRRRARWLWARGQLGPAIRRKVISASRRPAVPGDGSAPVQNSEFLREMTAIRDRYSLAPYPGAVNVFATAEYVTSQAFWRRNALGGLAWHELPGSHSAVFRSPAVDRLAEMLGPALREAQRER